MNEGESHRPARRVPDHLSAIFWDGDLGTLDLDRHRDQIIERVLQDGTLEAVRWVLREYGDDVIRTFVSEKGAKRLDPKILSFWYSHYKLGDPPCMTRSSLIDSATGWRY